jgi:predicted 2-oxoglutarate/Fe(II)-dependent dioxygenase YbiX
MPEYQWNTEQTFTVTDFFTPAECAEAIERAEKRGFSDAPINSSFGSMIRKDIRNNERVMIDDAPFAAMLYSRIGDYVPHRRGEWTICGVNERLRLYRYDVGQQFNWHFDGAFERGNGERSQLTFMIYLNEDFVGGQTSIEELTIVPKTGMALFFVHDQLHKGQPVHRGRKYVLRTDVMYRRDVT